MHEGVSPPIKRGFHSSPIPIPIHASLLIKLAVFGLADAATMVLCSLIGAINGSPLLFRAGKVQLPPGFIQGDSRAIGEINATAVRMHGNAHHGIGLL